MFMHPGGLLVQLKQLETMPIEYLGAKANTKRKLLANKPAES
jgi:hypothetical protein